LLDKLRLLKTYQALARFSQVTILTFPTAVTVTVGESSQTRERPYERDKISY